MNIQEIILKSKRYETIEVYRNTMTIDSMGRDSKLSSKIGTHTVSVQCTGSMNKVQGLTLDNSQAGERVKEVYVMYSPIIDIQETDIVLRLDDGKLYEVRSIEQKKVKPTKLKNGNILDLSHTKTYLTRMDNQ